MTYPGVFVIRSAAITILMFAVQYPTQAIAASPAQVNASVQKAIRWLYQEQKPGGHWETNARRSPIADTHMFYGEYDGPVHGGWTALCTFALLEAGEKPGDPRVARAISYLRAADLQSVYSLALRCMVFAKLPATPENKAILEADAARILASRIPEGPAKGLWDYEVAKLNGKRSESGLIDHSISQFGVLGLWACVQAGVNIPPNVWREFEQIWRKHQHPDGGWAYESSGPGNGRPTSPGITCAGVATLLIVQDIVGAAPAGGGIASTPGGVAATSDIAIVRGLGWLDRNFDRLAKEGTYSWYAVERIGTAGGYRYIGKHDWYEEGVRALLSTQDKDGHWETATGTVAGTPISETALGVLFLVHGRAPVLISKLNYNAAATGISRDMSWNQRPRDVANLVRYTGNSAEQPYNWQVASLAAPTNDLLEVPVMYMSGMRPVTLLDREREKLKLYIEGGGMILANSEAAPPGGVVGSDAFSKSIIELGQKMFGYTFRELPLDHPIFTQQQFRPKQWKEKPVVWGMSNGVRELIVLLPLGDHGRSWNFNGFKNDPMKFEVGADILQYAVSREPPPSKGQSHIIKPRYVLEIATSQPATAPATAPAPIGGGPTEPPPATQEYLKIPSDARKMVVGRLKVGENWDPEPGAWRRLANLLANDFKLFVEVRPIAPVPAELAGVKLLHWTGTTPVKLTDAERAAIEAFVKAGGTLVVDAAGGSPEFADAAFEELKAIFKTQGDTIGTVLGDDDPLYRMREARIEKFEYRKFFTNIVGRLNAPRVQGIDRAGRTIVYFSREDITGGCVGQNTDGIRGYMPETATAIMRNIALAAAKR